MVDVPSLTLKQIFATNQVRTLALAVAIEKNKINTLTIKTLSRIGFLGSNARIYIHKKQQKMFTGNKSFSTFQSKHNFSCEHNINGKNQSLFYYVYAVLNSIKYQQQFATAIAFGTKIRIPTINHLQTATDFAKLVAVGPQVNRYPFKLRSSCALLKGDNYN